MRKIRLTDLVASFLLFTSLIAPSVVLTQSTSPDQTKPAATAPPDAAKPPAAKPSTADIAAAKASGKVYHKAGRWYGKTKDGKFMTEDEARKAGYKAAKRD
jgi:hypothetical protein